MCKFLLTQDLLPLLSIHKSGCTCLKNPFARTEVVLKSMYNVLGMPSHSNGKLRGIVRSRLLDHAYNFQIKPYLFTCYRREKNPHSSTRTLSQIHSQAKDSVLQNEPILSKPFYTIQYTYCLILPQVDIPVFPAFWSCLDITLFHILPCYQITVLQYIKWQLLVITCSKESHSPQKRIFQSTDHRGVLSWVTYSSASINQHATLNRVVLNNCFLQKDRKRRGRGRRREENCLPWQYSIFGRKHSYIVFTFSPHATLLL